MSDGLSADEIAVAHGFIGSEAAGLAYLQGPRGEDGAPGACVDPEAVRSMVAEAVVQLQGPKGEPGKGGGPAVRPWRMHIVRDADTMLISTVHLGHPVIAPSSRWHRGVTPTASSRLST